MFTPALGKMENHQPEDGGQLTPSEGEGFSQGRKGQLDPESCGLTDLGHKLMQLTHEFVA